MSLKIIAVCLLSASAAAGAFNQGTSNSSSIHNIHGPKSRLSAPASWDYGYYGPAAEDNFVLVDNTENIISSPEYTRSADGQYYNYTSTFNIVTDLSVTMTFNRSNSPGWYEIGETGYYGYEYFNQSGAKIGSDSNVGTAIKNIITITNTTQNDYAVVIDVSSTAMSRIYYNNNNNITEMIYTTPTTLSYIHINAYQTYQLRTDTTNEQRYFDALYIKDLGVSDSYSTGYDDGYDHGYDSGYIQGNLDGTNYDLPNGLEDLLFGVFDSITSVFTIEVFDNITLGTMLFFPFILAIFGAIIYFLVKK